MTKELINIQLLLLTVVESFWPTNFGNDRQ